MPAVIERQCRSCGATATPNGFYCKPCKRNKVLEASKRFRSGIVMAPGEVSVARQIAVKGLGEVAATFQVSRQRIQQIERVALLKLRRAMMPFLQEHDPSAYDRLKKRETPGQAWAARTSVRRQLSAKQSIIIAQLKQLAQAYKNDGQLDTAAEIRAEVENLCSRLEHVFKHRTIDT